MVCSDISCLHRTAGGRLLAFVLCCILAAGCVSGARRALDKAESLLPARADSAMAVLRGISAEELRTQGLQARYALLVSMALEGRGEVPESDSLARKAYDYYQHHGGARERMHAANCLADIEYHNGELTDAILYYYNALSSAVGLRDLRMEGFICQRLGELFALNYDHEEALSYARRASDCLRLAGEPLSAAYSGVDQARQLLALNRLSAARAMADSLMDANHFGEPGYDYYLYLLKADVCSEEGDGKEALQYYRLAEDTGYLLPLSSISRYLLLLENDARHDKSDSLFQQMRARLQNGLDSIVYQGVMMEHARLSGDYEEAFHSLTQLSEIQNRSFTQVISQSASHALKAYFEEQYRMEQLRRHSQKLRLTLVILLLCILVVVSFFVLRQRRRRLEQEMSLVETLSRDVQMLEMGKKRTDTVIAAMVQDRIRSMSQLMETYFSWTDEAVRQREREEGLSNKEAVISSFRHELKGLRSDTTFLQSIEDALNQSQGQIMQRLRSDFSGLNSFAPKYKESDFRFVMLFFAGFSNKSVSFILDMTDEAVRSKKKRCKQQFLSLPEGRGKEYVELL